MSEILKGDSAVMSGLENLATGKDAVRYTTDSFGNGYGWYLLNSPALIVNAADILKRAGARLAIIAAYNPGNERNRMRNACYEFVLGGVVYSCTVAMNAENPTVPSITPIFANADWHEREMMELFGVHVAGHPDPRRLFLDEELDKGLMGQIVPLSVMMNGASSADLWERILSAREA